MTSMGEQVAQAETTHIPMEPLPINYRQLALLELITTLAAGQLLRVEQVLVQLLHQVLTSHSMQSGILRSID